MVNGPAVARGRLAAALADAAGLAPLLLLLAFAGHAVEYALAGPVALPASTMLRSMARALLADTLAVARYGPVLLLACLPWLLARRALLRVGGTWFVLVLVLLAQAALAQYFLRAGVPLGADLFAYTADDIRQTTAGAQIDSRLLIATAALAALAGWLATRRLHRPPPSGARLVAFGALSAFAWMLWLAGLKPGDTAATEYLRALQANKPAWFVDDLLLFAHERTSRRAHHDAMVVPAATARANQAQDPRYPFLHAERTPDTLGPLLALDPRRPPNIVILIVEGLGRSFSGAGARLGSYTPFLDSLAASSLSWDAFLAPQGRTFGVLPSVLGSLPFGEHGFLELPTPLPAHQNLPTLLRRHGYLTRYYSGTRASFDKQLAYLEQTGFARILDRGHLDAEVPVANDWGYDDDTLLRYVAATEARDAGRPWFDVVQTISMHSPYSVPDETAWRERVGQRVAALGLDKTHASAARAQADVYAAILFADEALRRYFAAAATAPHHANTIYVVTGDHRLPEIPMEERIERYHVPLVIASPLVKHAARYPALSSHFDLAPTLAAMLAKGYGWQRPASTTWLGAGLDTQPHASDGRDIPLKQTKTELSDFVSGDWYLGRGQLYRLGAGLATEPVIDARQRARVQSRFDAFLEANARFAQERRLAPPGDADDAGKTDAPAGTPSRALGIASAEVEADASGAQVTVRFTLANGGAATSVAVAPLAVLLDGAGRELQEAYGQAVQLQAHERIPLHLRFDTGSLVPGDYFVAVFASNPQDGVRIGTGRYHMPVTLRRGAVP